jgi:hypothetical protein
MTSKQGLPIVRVFRVIWRDRQGILHATGPRFLQEDKARRFARLLRNDPAVVDTRIMPLVLRPLLPGRHPA